MIVIALLHDKTLILLDHASRKLMHLPVMQHMVDDDHYVLVGFGVMNYMYENTIGFNKRDLIHFEE